MMWTWVGFGEAMRLSSVLVLACFVWVALPAAADIPVEGGTIAGRLILAVESADPGAFGLGAGQAKLFIADFEMLLDDPPAPGETPPDGDYTGSFTSFDAGIGNTMWDASMPHGTPIIRVVAGVATEMSVDFTKTMPTHPDLCIFLADPDAGSLASWLAFDEVSGIDNGSLVGSYALLATSTTPALGSSGQVLVALLLLVGARKLGFRRRR